MRSLTPGDLKWLEETLAKLQEDVTIVYFTEEATCRHCRRERELLAELADLSHKLHLEVYNFVADRDAAETYGIDKIPALAIVGEKDYGVRYYGMPSDFEFRMLLEDIVRLSSGESGLSAESKDELHRLSAPLHLEVLTTPACPDSVGAVWIAHQMAMESDRITTDVLNVDDFPDVAEHYKAMSAPTVVVNGSYCFYGALEESQFIEQVLEGAQGGGR
ncbi:MAG: thioredoxin family protein [Phycisphaerae bacterium]